MHDWLKSSEGKPNANECCGRIVYYDYQLQFLVAIGCDFVLIATALNAHVHDIQYERECVSCQTMLYHLVLHWLTLTCLCCPLPNGVFHLFPSFHPFFPFPLSSCFSHLISVVHDRYDNSLLTPMSALCDDFSAFCQACGVEFSGKACTFRATFEKHLPGMYIVHKRRVFRGQTVEGRFVVGIALAKDLIDEKSEK